MGVLKFDGSDDGLKFVTLNPVLANVTDGPWTFASVVKRNSETTWDPISVLLSGTDAGTQEASLWLNINDDLVVAVDGTADRTVAGTFTTGPYMFVVSKGAGTVAPRGAYKTGSGGAWTHADFDGTVADQIAATMLQIGARGTADFFDGWQGINAWWEGAMSDANKEALGTNWRTSDLWNSAHGTPAFLAELNVVGASVFDLAVNASGLTATGTTLDGAETLDGWTFNGKGLSARTMMMMGVG